MRSHLELCELYFAIIKNTSRYAKFSYSCLQWWKLCLSRYRKISHEPWGAITVRRFSSTTLNRLSGRKAKPENGALAADAGQLHMLLHDARVQPHAHIRVAVQEVLAIYRCLLRCTFCPVALVSPHRRYCRANLCMNLCMLACRTNRTKGLKVRWRL